MSFIPSTALEPPSSAERRSFVVFSTILVLVLLALAFPDMPPQALQGILWTGAGVIMLLLPPEVRVPRVWLWLGIGFVLASLAGFLPRAWFHVSPWRLDLETLGIDTGPYAFVQPLHAAETLSGFAVTALVTLFLLGHRVGTRFHHRVVLGFMLGVGIWTLAALKFQHADDVFGFFPNRNHTATLLSMATFVSIGSFAQAIRMKAAEKIAISVIFACLFLGALLTVSESRAGIVLVASGLLAWISLTGFRHLRGHSGKALALLLIAFGGIFLITDSKVKSRLAKTVEHIETAPETSEPPKLSFDGNPVNQQERNLEGRIDIFHDTWQMIRHESWTGVGPGQFAQVFPQYREKTNADNNSKCLHPESDWLMMLAENGWLATACLTAGVTAVFFTAMRQTRRGKARFLRTGSLVAALLLCLHGVFDVPGHRVGLAWAAALLLAASLRFPEANGSEADPRPSRLSKHCWRGLGLVLSLAGIGLLQAQYAGKPILPSAQARQFMSEAKSLYDTDQAAYDRAKAEGRDYQPVPSEDPLETALVKVKQAIDIAPLDPYPHYIRGVLALHYDDKHAIADHDFAIQRRLDPTRVNLAMEQAQSWITQDPRKVLELWEEAMRRAAAEEAILPDSPWGTVKTYEQALHVAAKDEALSAAALQLAGNNPRLLLIWARSSPASQLDREMPRLLSVPDGAGERKTLFQLWEKRGTKGNAANYSQEHPELSLTPP